MQPQKMNAAAVDRHRLVAQVLAAQTALGAHAGRRFVEFARARGGAIYELSNLDAIEREFAQFEWAEIDRLYTAIVLHAVRRDAVGRLDLGPLCREVRSIVGDKLRRRARRAPSIAFRALRRAAYCVSLSVMFMAVSTITSEACLHFKQRGSDVRGTR